MKKKLFVSLLSSLGLLLSLSACTTSPSTDEGNENVLGISLNYESYTFEDVGDTVGLTATLTIKEGTEYKGAVEWRSSAPSIASISVSESGVATVTANDGGECYISALAGFKLATCRISVPHGDDPMIGDVTLSESEVSLKPGTSKQISAMQNGTVIVSGVTWSSSNNEIAAVNDGLIIAGEEGTATITARYNDKSATCTVTVKSDAVVEFTISLDRRSATLIEGASTTLVANTSEPETVTWESSDNAVATVNEGVVTAVHEGSATITATARGQHARCEITVNPQTEDDEEKCVLVKFYIDYNNVNDDGLLVEPFNWYQNVPLKGCDKLPKEPKDFDDARDPAFPYFVGWSTHTIVDSKDDLWNMDTDFVDGTTYKLTLYGIWSDVEVLDK